MLRITSGEKGSSIVLRLELERDIHVRPVRVIAEYATGVDLASGVLAISTSGEPRALV